MAGPGGWVLALALLTQGLAVADLAAQHRTAKSLPDSKIGGFFGRHMVEVPRIDDAALRPAGSRTDGLRGARGLAETLENPTAPGQARISTHGPDLKPVGVGESLGGSPASNTTEFVAESPGLESVAINITSRTLVLHWTGKVDITFAADIKLDGQIACEHPSPPPPPPAPRIFHVFRLEQKKQGLYQWIAHEASSHPRNCAGPQSPQ